MNATKFFTLILAVTTLGFSDAASGQTFCVDWDGGKWPPASLVNDYPIGPGTVSFGFIGNTTAFVSGTPVDDLILNGSSTTLNTLHLQVDFEDRGDSVEMRTTFVGYPFGVVTDVSFTLYDIDIGELSGNNCVLPDTECSWQDQVTVKGILNGVSVVPTDVVFTSGFVDVTSTPGVGVTLDGVLNFYENFLDGVNVVIDFGISPIDTLVVTYTDGPLADLKPGNHGVGIGPICFEPKGCLDPPADMVAWWPLDEPRYTKLADIIRGNDGTPAGGPTSLSGQLVDNSLCFDGNQYVVVEDANDLDFGTGDLSIDAWIRTTIDSGTQYVVDKRANPTSPSGVIGYSMYLIDGKLVFQLADGNGLINCSSSCPTTAACTTWNSGPGGFVADGQWHHLAVTLARTSSTGVTLYVDGNPVGSFDPTCHLNTISNDSPLCIGCITQPRPIMGHFEGCIDEVELFNRALDPSEILVIFQAGSDGKCKCVEPPPEMEAWYTGDDCLPTDFLGNHHGTYVGASFCPAIPDPKVGGGNLGFDAAIPSYIEVPHAPGLNIGSGGFSIDGWIKTNAFGYRPIVEKGSLVRAGYGLRLQSGRLEFVVCDTGTCGKVLSPFFAQLNDDIWHHVAATYSRGPLRDRIAIYIDGASPASLLFGPLGSISNVDALLIGAGPSDTPPTPTTFFDGEMDEIEIFKRALDLSEIQAIFLAGIVGKCKVLPNPPDCGPPDCGPPGCVPPIDPTLLVCERQNRFVSIDPTTNGATAIVLKVEARDRVCSQTGGKCHTTADCRQCDGGADAGQACYVNSDCTGAVNKTCVGGTNDGASCAGAADCPLESCDSCKAVAGDECIRHPCTTAADCDNRLVNHACGFSGECEPVLLGYIDDPVFPGDVVPAYNGPADLQWSTVVWDKPAHRVWTEPVVHIGDCEIAPVMTYGISAEAVGGIGLWSDPLITGTILKPQGKFWGDLVGKFDGFVWSKPNFLVNVDDVSAMIKFLIDKPAPHITVMDLVGNSPTYINFLINVTDLQVVLGAFKGDPFPPTALTGIGYPEDGDVTFCP